MMKESSGRPLLLAMPFLHEAGRAVLNRQFDVLETDDVSLLRSRVQDASALFTYKPFDVSAEMMAKAPKLKIVAAGGSGMDHIDIEAAQAAGILATHCVGFGALSVAEHAIGLMLAVAKRIVENDAWVRSLRSFASRRDGGLYEEISGRTLVIIGFGAIGREIARIARHGFNMKVIAVTRNGRNADCADVSRTMPLADALAVADIVSVNTPLTKQTRGLLGEAEFSLVKQGCYVIDTSRGGVVDPVALHSALLAGRVAGAGLDVFDPEPPTIDNPLLSLPNVVLTPHCAGFTNAGAERLSLAAADDISRAMRGERPVGMVGTDEMWTNSRAARGLVKDQV